MKGQAFPVPSEISEFYFSNVSRKKIFSPKYWRNLARLTTFGKENIFVTRGNFRPQKRVLSSIDIPNERRPVSCMFRTRAQRNRNASANDFSVLTLHWTCLSEFVFREVYILQHFTDSTANVTRLLKKKL